VFKKEEQDRSADQYSVSWDCKLAGESQRATKTKMTKMSYYSPCELEFCPVDKNTYAPDLYLYTRRRYIYPPDL
jgi:hypothetical protein